MRASDGLTVLLAAAVLLTACSGGDEGSGSTVPFTSVIHTVGGTVSGLAGTGLTLQNNGNNNLDIRENGDFTFTTPLGNGTRFNVTVLTQPARPAQTCTVLDGSGTIASDKVTNVEVTCATNTYTLGGTVNGLAGAGLVLQNNAGDNLTITSTGAFTFPGTLTSGAAYDVTILTQPSVGPTQVCVVTNGNGTVANAAILNVDITCSLSITNSMYTVAAASLLFAANSPAGAASAIAVNALHGALALVEQ